MDPTTTCIVCGIDQDEVIFKCDQCKQHVCAEDYEKCHEWVYRLILQFDDLEKLKIFLRQFGNTKVQATIKPKAIKKRNVL